MKLTKVFIGLSLMCLMCGCSKTKEQPILVSDEVVTTTTTTQEVKTTKTTAILTTLTTTETTTEVTSTEKSLTSPTTAVTTFANEITPVETESLTESFYALSEPCEETEIYVEYSAPITEQERILLCNLVAREYGSDWISTYEKSKVVAVVMNRVHSESFPDTIYDVVTQPNQFSGYVVYDYYASNVTQDVQDSVDYYFAHTDEFGDYLYFEGDGTYNYFH